MRYVTQRYKIRAEDGRKFVLTRWEWDTPEEAQACADEHAATETGGALYEVIEEERDGVPAYVEPLPAEPVADPDAELALAIESATTLAELKKALLGQTKAAAVKGRTVE